MADFSDLFSQYLGNRVNQATQPFSDPSGYVENRIRDRLGLTTSTQAPAEQPAPVNPRQMGPTVAANMGQQPTNPLNGQGAMPAAAPVKPEVQQPAISPDTTVGSQLVTPPASTQPQVKAPAVPQDYANYVQQNESGANPNIGYHNPQKGTAYGAYGITAPAYQDVQKSDPYFAGRDITSLSQEDQNRALNVYTQNNSRALQNYGVETNPGNLSLAHFLGAKGASDYLKNGTVSPAAAAANGGEDRVRQIAQQRLQFGAAPASGAVTPQAQPAAPEAQPEEQAMPTGMGLRFPNGATVNHYNELNSNDPQKLMSLAYNLSTPPSVVRDALDRLHGDIQYQNKMAKYSQQVDTDLNNGQIPNVNKKGEEGSYLKAILYARLGLNDLAAQEQEKISPTKSTMPVMLGNDHYSATYNKNGDILYARDEAGNYVDNATLAKLSANAFASKGAKTEAAMVQDPKGDAYSKTVIPGRAGFMWRNERTGEMSPNMPQGAIPFGQINPVTKATITTAASTERNMRRTNDAFVKQGLPPKYTEEQIQDMKLHITNGGQAPAELGATPVENAPAVTSPVATPNVMQRPTAAGQPQTPGPATGALPDALEKQAQEIYAGRQPMPTGLGASNLRNQAIVSRVQQLAAEKGQPFDPSIYGQHKKTEDAFNTGKQGDITRSMNTAIDHMDTLREKIQKLPTGQYPAMNDIIVSFAKGIGDARINSYDAAAGLIAAEVTKAIVANGGTGSEREEKEKLLAMRNNPEALRGALNSYTQLLGGQLHNLKNQYIAGHGSNWEPKVSDRTHQAIAESQIGRPWNDQDKAAAQWAKTNANDPRAAKIKKRLGLD
jgi:hypothetical protein